MLTPALTLLQASVYFSNKKTSYKIVDIIVSSEEKHLCTSECINQKFWPSELSGS
jgi:hypothetical protein